MKTPSEVRESKNHIGPLLRLIRIARGYGLNEFALEADLNPSNLSRFERGRVGALKLPDSLYPMAEVLRTSVPAIFVLWDIVGRDHTKWAPEVADMAYLISLLDQANTGIARIHAEVKPVTHY